jgi:hemerythrin-like domain-containing protein
MNLLDKLREEHEEVKGLLHQMCEDENAGRRQKLFKEFKTAMTKHSRGEEKVLYERLIDTGEDKPELLGNEGFIEHDVADELIAKLGRARNKGDVKWTAGIKVLTDIIEHHIEEEEKEVFKETRRNFKAAQLNEMEEEFEKVKAKVRG